MAKLTSEQIEQILMSHLDSGEELKNWAFGVKQPSILLILPLFALAIIPGVIATQMLTKNYVLGLTDRRLIILQVKSITNAEVKEVMEYPLENLHAEMVKTSTGALFTHIKIADEAKPFVAKFHRGFSKSNRSHAMAIAEAIST